MAIVLDGTAGITSPAETIQGNLTTTGNTILGDASTDTLNVGNGGLIKDASGNVGIGTSSPVAKLDVRGIFAISNSAASYWALDRNDSDGSLTFTDTSTERMRIDSSGNLSGANIAATFTPTLWDSGSDTISYNGTGQVLTGAYTRISKVVTVTVKYTQTNAIQTLSTYQTLRFTVPSNITGAGATLISAIGNIQTGTYPNQNNYSFNSAGISGGGLISTEHWGTGNLNGQTNPVFSATLVYLMA
jgi:hypothetical protein